MLAESFVEEIKNEKNVLVERMLNGQILCRPKFGNKTQTIKIPLEITPDLSFLCGVIVGDGHLWKTRRRIGIEMTRKDILEMILKKFNNVFDISLKLKEKHDKRINRKPTWRIDFENKAIWLLFSRVFEIPVGKKSDIVKAPKLVMRNLDCMKMFFSGLFLADGGRKGNRISFTTSSSGLFDNVQTILNTFDINFFTRKWVHNKSKRLVFDIIISRKSDINKFMEIFPLIRIKFKGCNVIKPICSAGVS